jgi:hypothetical protein
MTRAQRALEDELASQTIAGALREVLACEGRPPA